MKRLITTVLLSLLLVCIAGCCSNQDLVTNEAKTYNIATDIDSLNIRINAAEFRIEHGERFSVTSNLKNLEIDEKNGTLILKDLTKTYFGSNLFGKNPYENAMLTIYIPEDAIFDSINISTGAGRFTVDELSAKRIDFEFGAGDALINVLEADVYANIEGGAGRITISDGMLNDLDIEMGVGELNLTSRLSGDCNLEMGLGASNITLIGSIDDYELDIDKGLGSISVDGKDVSDFGSSGNGSTEVEISGGIGDINVKFTE